MLLNFFIADDLKRMGSFVYHQSVDDAKLRLFLLILGFGVLWRRFLLSTLLFWSMCHLTSFH